MSDPRIKQWKLENMLNKCEHGRPRRKCPHCELVELKAQNQQIRKVLHGLVNDVLCLCSEGPDIMRAGDIYAELIKEANKARQACEEES